MNKSTRILSILLAFTMLLGIVSVAGSAYDAYKGAAIANSYDDTDKATFTTDQYASMALDELDRMLSKEQILLTEEDIFVGTLDITSVNATLSSVCSLIDSASSLLSLLGSAGNLNIDSLFYDIGTNTPFKRSTAGDSSGNATDLRVIKAVIDFLYDNKDIITSYVSGSFSLGILDAVVPKYDVRNVVLGLLEGIMDKDFDWEEDTSSYTNLDQLLQDLVEFALIGKVNDTGTAYELVLDDQGKPVNKGIIWDFISDLSYAEISRIYEAIDIVGTDATAYDYIENLMRCAYNYIAVPELNEVTRPWLREVCGVEYIAEKMDPNSPAYVPGYDGEPFTSATLNNYQYLFDVANMRVPLIRVPEIGDTITRNGMSIPVLTEVTFISYFNDALYEFLSAILAEDEGVDSNNDGNSWTWILCEDLGDYEGRWKGTDSYLFQNIASVARYVLSITGDTFFADYIDTYNAATYTLMDDQAIYAFVIRAILNASVDWMYIDDSNVSVADVCYAAVEQLAWQDVPQLDYTKPVRTAGMTDVEYYDAIVDQCLDILLDIAVFNLNQTLDVIPARRAAGQSPAVATNSGLLEYRNDYETLALEIAVWAVCKYGSMLTAPGCSLSDIQLDNNNGAVGNLTINDLWEDVDLIINSIFPISTTLQGDQDVWLFGEIANSVNTDGGSDVVRSIIFDYIAAPILELDATDFEKIFSKNENGTFASDTVKDVLITLVTDIINLVFPGTITTEYNALDEILNNNVLATIVGNLLTSFYDRYDAWIVVILPVLCDILGLTSAQEFDEMDVFLPENIDAQDATAGNVQFQVYNGCSGLNTGYTNTSGVFTQDQLYTYEITAVNTTSWVNGVATGGVSAMGIAPGNTIIGGDGRTVILSGNFTPNSIIELSISYKVKNETGGYITNEPLTCTKYAYVGNTVDGDDVTRDEADVGNGSVFTVSYAPAIYLAGGRGLSNVENYNLLVKRHAQSTATTATVTGVTGANWIGVTADTTLNSIGIGEGDTGNYYLAPLATKDGFTRYSESYNALRDVTEESFAARTETYYVKNDLNLYTAVSASAAFDADEVYYTYKNNNNNAAGDTVIGNGKETISIAVNVGGTTVNVPVDVYLYDDYGLGSLYSNVVTGNRQQSDYRTSDANFDGAWNAYKTAVQNAANLVLAPKATATFEARLAATNPNYPNRYAQYYDELQDAVEALDEMKVSEGVEGLKAAVELYNGRSNSYYLESAEAVNDNYKVDGGNENVGWNNVNYYATASDVGTTTRYAYNYFGYRDYVPHTYRAFRDARDRANNLINSVTVYPPVQPEAPAAGASIYEMNKYAEAMAEYTLAYAEYEEKLANIPALSPVDVAYALHMVNLTGGRLIPLPADTDKLAALVAAYGSETNLNGQYSTKTFTAYTNALNFANATLAASNIKPSRVNTATSKFVKAYKELVAGVDYANLIAAVEFAEPIVSFNLPTPGDTSAISYTTETWDPFYAAYVTALDLIEAELGLTDANQDRVDHATAALNATRLALVSGAYGAQEPFFEFVTEDTGYFIDYNFMYSFTPFLDSDFGDNYLGTGYTYLSGLGVFIDESCIDYIINPETLTNAYVVVVPSEIGSFGTGSKIEIYNEATDELIESYDIVIYGDVTGESESDSADVATIALNGVAFDWEWDDEDHFDNFCAADVNADWTVDSTDTAGIASLDTGSATITQGPVDDYPTHTLILF